MKGLTIHQPWAWAIAEGLKRVENRSWRTHYRGPLVIHAGINKQFEKEGRDWMHSHRIECPESLEKGKILGVCQLIDCMPIEVYQRHFPRDRWAFGPYCWVLSDFQSCAELVAYRGRQGLYDVDLAALTEIYR